jgi:hypothetical protein
MLQCNDPDARLRGIRVLFLGGNGLHTKIPTNCSDFISPFLVGCFLESPRTKRRIELFRALGTRRPLIEET